MTTTTARYLVVADHSTDTPDAWGVIDTTAEIILSADQTEADATAYADTLNP